MGLNLLPNIPLQIDVARQVTMVRVVDFVDGAEGVRVVEVVEFVVSFLHIIFDTITILIIDSPGGVGVTLEEG